MVGIEAVMEGIMSGTSGIEVSYSEQSVAVMGVMWYGSEEPMMPGRQTAETSCSWKERRTAGKEGANELPQSEKESPVRHWI